MRKDQSTLYDNERVSLEKLLNKRDPSHDKNLPIMPVTESSLNIFTLKNSLYMSLYSAITNFHLFN